MFNRVLRPVVVFYLGSGKYSVELVRFMKPVNETLDSARLRYFANVMTM